MSRCINIRGRANSCFEQTLLALSIRSDTASRSMPIGICQPQSIESISNSCTILKQTDGYVNNLLMCSHCSQQLQVSVCESLWVSHCACHHLIFCNSKYLQIYKSFLAFYIKVKFFFYSWKAVKCVFIGHLIMLYIPYLQEIFKVMKPDLEQSVCNL